MTSSATTTTPVQDLLSRGAGAGGRCAVLLALLAPGAIASACQLKSIEDAVEREATAALTSSAFRLSCLEFTPDTQPFEACVERQRSIRRSLTQALEEIGPPQVASASCKMRASECAASAVLIRTGSCVNAKVQERSAAREYGRASDFRKCLDDVLMGTHDGVGDLVPLSAADAGRLAERVGLDVIALALHQAVIPNKARGSLYCGDGDASCIKAFPREIGL